MEWLLDKLDGRKTYLVALATVVYGVYLGWSGDMAWPEAMNYVLSGGALAAVRDALNKVGL